MPEAKNSGGAGVRARMLVVGDVMTDVIVKPDGPLVHGSDRSARIAAHHGGAGANQAMWLAHHDVPVRFAARVGHADRDAIGARLAAHGVDPVLVPDPEASTGMLVSVVDPDGERSFFTDRGANLNLGASDLPETLLAGVAAFGVSGYALFAPGPRAAVGALMAAARARGVSVCVDPASVEFLEEVGVGAFLSWTRGAAMLFPNAEEAALLSGRETPEAQIAALSDFYDLVVIKLGADGAVAGGRGRAAVRVPAPPARVLDTTGAGDAFFAGFMAARLSGADLAEALDKGAAAGSLATTRFGAQPEVPDDRAPGDRDPEGAG